MVKVKYISITLCQQGGIGWPPMIIKLNKKWYAISDSREKSLHNDFYNCGILEKDKYHCQGWALRKWRKTTNRITTKEVEKRLSETEIFISYELAKANGIHMPVCHLKAK